MADIYRYEWQQPATGATVRIDIAMAGSTPLPDTLVVEVLNDDCVFDLPDFTWGFDKFVYGLPSPIEGKIVFVPSRMPLSFVTDLIDGIKGVTSTIYTGHDVTFDTGPTFTFYVKQKGQSTFTRYWIGVMDVTKVVRPDFVKDRLEINIGDLIQHAMKVLRWPDIRDADWDKLIATDPGEVTPRSAVVDYLWIADSRWWYAAHIPPGRESNSDTASCYWAVPMNIIVSYWNTYLFEIIATIMRKAHSVTISPAFIALWEGARKQTYAPDAIPGAVLPTGDIHLLPFVTNNNFVGPGTERNFSMHDELGRAFKCVWDWLADTVRGKFKGIAFTYGSTISAYAFSPMNPGVYTDTVDIMEAIRSISISMRDRIASLITSSTQFGIGEDAENSEPATPPAGRNNDGTPLPVVIDSSPVANGWIDARTWRSAHGMTYVNQEVRDRLQNTQTVEDGTVYLSGRDKRASGNPRLLGVYYLDTPTGSPGNAFHTTNNIIRCHGWQEFAADGETVSPPSTQPAALPTVAGPDYAGDIQAVIIATQVQQGGVAQLAKRFFETYYGVNTTTVRITIAMDVGQGYVSDTNNTMIPFHWNIRLWPLDLASLAPYMSMCPTSYWMLSCKTNVKTGLSECELWGKA